MTLSGFDHVHFVGMGGVGMSALAEILLSRGLEVSGSDTQPNPLLGRLAELGARVEIGHSVANLGPAQALVVSSAIPDDNPELVEARRRGLPLLHRSELLAELMRGRRSLTVAGTHGKTTTCAMLGAVLIEAGFDPTVVVGAHVDCLGGNTVVGQGEFFVAEADESDRSFLRFEPEMTVVTNIDRDHLDEYSGLEDISQAFLEHMNRVSKAGWVVGCADDVNLAPLLKKVQAPVLTYGLLREAEVSAADIELKPFGSRFHCTFRDRNLGTVQLRVPGLHNVTNALGVIGAARLLDAPFDAATAALARFTGASRRFEWKGERDGVWVVDDYAHHPTEILATLASCRELERSIAVVFQPHRFSRTEMLLDELAESFGAADRLYLLDVYGAGEAPSEGIGSDQLAKQIARRREVCYEPDHKELVDRLKRECKPGDLLLTMGAGDVWRIGDAFLEETQEKSRQ